MNNLLYINGIFILLYIALFILFFRLFRKLIIIQYRNLLFDLRTDLFRYILNSKRLDYDSKCYIQTRYMINGFIRYAERHSIIEFLLMSDYDDSHDIIGKDQNPDIIRIIQALDNEDRDFFDNLLRKILKYTFITMALTNPLMSPFFIIIYVLTIIFNMQNVWHKINRGKKTIQMSKKITTLMIEEGKSNLNLFDRKWKLL